MWITPDVNLPTEVVEAHAQGRLVFFVGAGASMDPPSGLPSFFGLARKLAELARVPFDDKAAIDTFLGSLPKSFDTHAHALRLINRKDSTHNPTHLAIVHLASASGVVRIVTTNFDDHLTSAALAASIEIGDIWIGPALPLGDAFSGVVYLHGSVRRASSEELVLDDRDFGRAYLTDAWTTRFLQRMFATFTVLFIGYSHDDPIMRYLSLGLPSNTRRFVLTHEPDDEKWSHLGIGPIGYPAKGNDHKALVVALQAWDRRARMGLLDHRARMRELVEAGPTMTPIDLDYITDRLRTVDGVKDFTRFASGEGWLQWAESLPLFKTLFKSALETEVAQLLGDWFAQKYIAEPALHRAALQTVQRLGQQFDGRLWQSAHWAAEQLGRKDARAGWRWKTFLATSIYGQSAPPNLEMLLLHLEDEGTQPLAVIRTALRPFLVLQRPWLLDSEDTASLPNAEVRWHTNADILTEVTLKLVSDAEPGDPLIGSILEDTLSGAYDLLSGYYGEGAKDPLSFGRSGIEPHEQDRFRDPIDALIDALRDYGLKAQRAVPGLPERWWSLGQGLFRRLALHLINADGTRQPEDKIRWVMNHSLLYQIDVKHETFNLIAANISKTSASVKNALLVQVLAGPVSGRMPQPAEHTQYSTYNLLIWLVNAAPEWREAQVALQEIETLNPTFRPREHPDLDMWSSSGSWGGREPIAPEDFVRSADDDLRQALDDLVQPDYSERNFDEPTWEDALSVVRRAAELRPDLGVQLWRLIDQRRDLGSRAIDLRRALIGGWSQADLGSMADDINVMVRSAINATDEVRSISQFILAQIRKRVDSQDSSAIEEMRQIASDTWRVHRHSFSHPPGSDPANLSLNSWPGDLARYWLVEIDRRWRNHRNDWSGLNSVERGSLLDLLTGPEATLAAVGPALAGEVFFLFAADADFTQDHVFPLFQHDEAATLAWREYLHHPRYNDRMLGAGFLESVVTEWGRLEALNDRALEHQFFGIVASILTFAGITPEERQILLDQTVLARDGAYAPEFAAMIVRLLSDGTVNGPQIWVLWLRSHLVSRLEGLPRTATTEETARWADVAPFLAEEIPDAIGLLDGRNIGLGDKYDAPNFPAEAFELHGPDLIVNHLADRVRNSSPTGWRVPHAVRELIVSLRAAVGEDACAPLVRAATESGFLPEDQL